MPRQAPPPDWVVADMVTLSQVEPALFPDPHDRQQMWHDVHPVSAAGAVYFQQLEPAFRESRPHTVLVLPGLTEPSLPPEGSAVLAATVATAPPGSRVTLLTTGTDETSRATSTPLTREATLIPFGHETRSLPAEEKLALLAQMILNSPAQVLHVMHAQEGWEIIRLWARQFRHVGLRLHVTLFEDERNHHGIPVGPAATVLPLCSRHLDAIYTASPAMATLLHHRDGIPRDRLFPFST